MMYSQVLKYLFTGGTVHALFATLIHSLWQGVLLAIAVGLVLTFTKRSPSVVRYNMLCAAMLLFIAGAVLTFYCEMNFTTAGGHEAIAQPTSIVNTTSTGNTALNNQHHFTIIERIITFIKLNEDSIVLVWLLIIGFKCIQLLTGLRSIYVLKHRHVFEAGEYWNAQLKQLANKIGVLTPVRLLRSAIAKVPMVAGHFKPIILVPATMLTTLPEKEIEAILLHELAHIRRRDYLVNMLQSLAGIIFFFNPAVLWLSSLIRDERENCCDDIAIGEVKSKREFIHALLCFQEYNIHSNYAASFPGRKKHLVNRVRRIITNNNKTLNSMEKIFLASGILVTCLILASFSNERPPQKQSTVQVAKKPAAPITDTVPKTQKTEISKSKSTINTSIDGKQYKIVEENGNVTELYVDNVRVPDNKISEYKPTIDTIHQRMKAVREKQVAQMKMQEKQVTAQAKMMKEKEQLMKEEMSKQAGQMKLQQKQLLEESEIMNQKQALMKQEFVQQADQMKIQQKQLIAQSQLMKEKELLMKQNFNTQVEQMKIKQQQLAEQSQLMNQKELLMKKELLNNADEMKLKQEQLMKEMQQLKEMQELKEKKMPDSIPQSKVTPHMKSDELKATLNDIVQELQKADLATNDVDNLSFSLTSKHLTVNGIEQPGELFQRLKLKYINDLNDHIIYNTLKKSSRVDVVVNVGQ